MRVSLSAAAAVAFVLLFGIGPADARIRDTGDLDLNPAHVPYQTNIVNALLYGRDKPEMTSYMMADLEGDGNLELVTGDDGRLLGWDCEDGYIKARFQINLAPGWRFHHHSDTRLGVVTDLNGDHISEVHLTLVREDRSAWRFQTIDLATQQVIVDVPLPLGVDRRPDGVWDGSYMPMGVLDDADGRGTTGIVLLRNAGYDANPRGVLVVNARTGDEIWEWQCGPNPDTRSLTVCDLDGDGTQEIVLFGNSPDNLDGQLVNGTSDDHSYFFVLSATGHELWRQELGGVFVAGAVLVADLNGDGKPEIITRTANGASGQMNRLIVWDFPTRSRIVSQRQGARFLGLAVLPGPESGSSWLVTGSNDGFLTRYLYTPGHLTRDIRRFAEHDNCQIVGAVDILPEPGLEVLADIDGGRIFVVLSAELRPLAVMSDGNVYARGTPVLWQRSEQHLSLVVGENKAHYVLEFVHRAGHLPVLAKIVLGVFLLLALMTAVYFAGRRSGRGLQVVVAPDPGRPRLADREVLFRMWRQLDDVKHEKFLEANRGLRRLVWLLEAYAADLGASETLGVRIGQLLDDFNDSVQPRLLEILRLADTEKFEPEAVARAAKALDKLGQHLGNLDVETLTMESVRAHGEDMNEALGEVEAGFLHLWQALRRYFSTDPVRMLQGMLLVREVEFERAGVDTVLTGIEAVADPVCLIDSSSLRFILDNLVENALRAMSDSSRKLLEITVDRTATELTLRVSDSGAGISSEWQDTIFNGRTSDRPGGGAGLFRTREILQRWRGEIQLDRSLSGQGTTFIVKLRAANKVEASATGGQTMHGEA